MKPLIVLLASFGVITFGSRIFLKDWNLEFAGNLAMCLMLILTASGHLLFTKGMEKMVPPFIPFKTLVVYITGAAEIILGLALLLHATRFPAGIALIILFLLLLPANIYAAMNHLNMENPAQKGPGPAYLWFRIPLQALFIGWIFYFSIWGSII